jgi:dTMP kinase
LSRLLTIEGIDGAGKTTLAAALLERLRGRGVEVELLREPGGVRAAELVRSLVKDPSLVIGARAEALLYAAARAQLVEERVRPLLAGGTWVLLDRFVDSSLAYQGVGRGLGIDAVRAINDFGTGGLTPDRTVLLAIEPAVAAARLSGRGEAPDRLELERADFFAAITAGYEEIAAAAPERVFVVDAEQPTERVVDLVLGALSDLLPPDRANHP